MISSLLTNMEPLSEPDLKLVTISLADYRLAPAQLTLIVEEFCGEVIPASVSDLFHAGIPREDVAAFIAAIDSFHN